MTAFEYLGKIFCMPASEELNFAEKKVGQKFVGEGKKITDNIEDSITFDNENYYRLLSQEEIKDCEKDMGVDFSRLNLLPIIDLCDNDYICYNYKKDTWIVLNTVDEIVLDEKESIIDFFM